MEPIAVILLVVWGILNIILFFKIWGATNDIEEMKYMMRSFINNTSYNSKQDTIHEQPSMNSVQNSLSKEHKEEIPTSQTGNIGIRPGNTILHRPSCRKFKIIEVRSGKVLVDCGLFRKKLEWLPIEEFDV